MGNCTEREGCDLVNGTTRRADRGQEKAGDGDVVDFIGRRAVDAHDTGAAAAAAAAANGSTRRRI